MRSAPSCFTFEPMKASSSPLLNPIPMSSRKDFGQRYMSTVSVPFFTSLSAFWWHLQFLNGPLEFGFGVKVILGRACCGWLAFLGLCHRCPETNHEKHQQEDNLAGKV